MSKRTRLISVLAVGLLLGACGQDSGGNPMMPGGPVMDGGLGIGGTVTGTGEGGNNTGTPPSTTSTSETTAPSDTTGVDRGGLGIGGT